MSSFGFVNMDQRDLDDLGVKAPEWGIPFLRALDDLHEFAGDDDFPKLMSAVLEAFRNHPQAAASILARRIADPNLNTTP